MCGIAGVVTSQGPVTGTQLEAANEAVRHRGPDEAGSWINAARTCGFGHVRLSIIDLLGGRQPLSSSDGAIHAIVNGEFYGFEAIRQEFVRDGYRFHCESDSEILIPLYLKYGTACLKHLRGEFALALWDERKQRLLLARDRFGIKPLFYGRHNGTFYFGSEVKALLAMGMPGHWDPYAVVDDELGCRNCEDTLFLDVKAVPPGHFMLVDGERSVTRRYWDFDYPRASELKRSASEQEYIEAFWELLTEAVALRLRADVPVGVYLSGGIDSSTVLSLMAQQMGKNLDAFTLSFDDAAYDEGDIARETARHLGIRHHVIDILPKDLAPHFESAIWHNECPFTNNNTIAKYILSRHVRDAGLKVVLTGEGSDEVLGGYDHFRIDMRRHSRAIGPVLARRKRWLQQRLGGWLPGRAAANGDAGRDVEFDVVRAKFGFVPQQLVRTTRAAAELAQLRTPALDAAASGTSRFLALMRSLDPDQLTDRHPLNQSLYLASKSTLPNRILTTLGDRVEMAHSVEARLPFLDHPLVEFLARLPVELKIKVQLRGGIEKYLLKEAARGHVTETLYRRRKHPFTAPPTESLADNPVAEVIEDILHGSDLRELDLYDQAKVLKLYERARRNGRIGYTMQHIAGLAIMQRKFGLSLA